MSSNVLLYPDFVPFNTLILFLYTLILFLYTLILFLLNSSNPLFKDFSSPYILHITSIIKTLTYEKTSFFKRFFLIFFFFFKLYSNNIQSYSHDDDLFLLILLLMLLYDLILFLIFLHKNF